MEAETGAKSLVQVIDPAPKQLPGPDAVTRALDVLKGAKRPLAIIGKGAAYAQEDETIRAFIEKSGIPYLPMSMAKGLLPDNHPQSAGAARSLVLKEADVVVMMGARLNWLLSHGKGQNMGRAWIKGSSRSISKPPKWTAMLKLPRRWWVISALALNVCLMAWGIISRSRLLTGSMQSMKRSRSIWKRWQAG